MIKGVSYKIVPLSDALAKDAERLAINTWRSTTIVANRELCDLRELPCFIAITDEQEVIGYCYYRLSGNECEIMAVESIVPGIGVGSAFIDAVKNLAREKSCSRLYLQTSNDNCHAIRFYQRRGFTMSAVRWNEFDYYRTIKPEIPMTGDEGIPLMHEIEFDMAL